MAKDRDKADRSRSWRVTAGAIEDIATGCRVGDRLVWAGWSYNEAPWRALRHRLHDRGLAVVAVGRGMFVAPCEALAQAGALRQLATAAGGADEAAGPALQDLTLEMFGPLPTSPWRWPRPLAVPGGGITRSPAGSWRRG